MQFALVFLNKLDNNSLNCLFHLYDTHIGVCNASVCCVYLYVHVSVIHTSYIVANRGQYVRSSPREQCGLFTVTWDDILNKKFTIHIQVIQTIYYNSPPLFIYFIRYEIYWCFLSCNLNTCAWGKNISFNNKIIRCSLFIVVNFIIKRNIFTSGACLSFTIIFIFLIFIYSLQNICIIFKCTIKYLYIS